MKRLYYWVDRLLHRQAFVTVYRDGSRSQIWSYYWARKTAVRTSSRTVHLPTRISEDWGNL